MGLQILDFILIGIMLLSGVLALMRGFTREVLSLIAWGLAALATWFAIHQQKLLDLAMPYVDKPVLAQVAVGAIVFLVVLIVVSVISVKISDLVVDSSAGAFDRTLGFFYGLARGFVLVAIAYLFYGWLLPPEKQEAWVRNAKSLPYIKTVGERLLAFMPPDIAETLNSTALAKPSDKPAAAGDGKQPGPGDPGYTQGQTQGLDNLINGTGGGAQPQQPQPQQPQFGQSQQGTGQ
jgi:membrane protein required for colicin V production